MQGRPRTPPPTPTLPTVVPTAHSHAGAAGVCALAQHERPCGGGGGPRLGTTGRWNLSRRQRQAFQEKEAVKYIVGAHDFHTSARALQGPSIDALFMAYS
jgi:hypothetical protein